MIRRYLAIVIALLSLLSCKESRISVSREGELVQELLTQISNSGQYSASKEASLARQKHRLESLRRYSEDWINTCEDISRAYSNFQIDSAVSYCNKAIKAALMTGNETRYQFLCLNMVSLLSKAGYFNEAESILNQLDPRKLPEDKRWQYYSVKSGYYHSLYIASGIDSEFREAHTKSYNLNRDTMLTLLPPDSPIILRENEKIAAREGRFTEALQLNEKRLDRLDPEDFNGRASALYDRHTIYRHYMRRPVSDHVEFILESAILDIKSANRDIASLHHVETYLLQQGDVMAAKTVSDFYFNTLLQYGSRTRLLNAQESSMQINMRYAAMLSRQQRLTQAGLIGIIVLLVVIIIILKSVLDSRHRIAGLNKDLERSRNAALSYVLSFFNLYSSYISRLLSIRSKINVSIRRGNYDYVLSLTDPSKDITAEELKAMYSYFDSAFLDIYPDYVEKFNALLRPECSINPKSDEKLTMELRIFAIIKLGITDSAKISELLHCSIKTVYNKRSEINSKLAVDKDVFMKKLLDI